MSWAAVRRWTAGTVILAMTACSASDLTGNKSSSNTGGNTGGNSGGSTQLSFWSDGPVSGGLDITLDGRFVGHLSTYFSGGTPQCGQQGTLTVTTTGGTHTASATATGLTWNARSFNITAGVCTTYAFNTGGNSGGGGSGGCPSATALIGSWRRLGDYGQPGATGLVVYWNGSTGVVTSNPGNSVFPPGTTKWYGYNASACTMMDLTRSTTGSSSDYGTFAVSLSGSTLTVGGTLYSKQ